MQAITPAQIRAARAILRITAQELADAAEVGVATIRRAEDDKAGQVTSKVVTAAIQRALEAEGIAFITHEDGTQGVTWHDPDPDPQPEVW